MTSVAFFLSTDRVTPSQKATGLVRQGLLWVKLCWLSQTTSLSSVCLSTAFRRICSMAFPGTEADRAVVSRVLLSTFIDGFNISFSSNSGLQWLSTESYRVTWPLQKERLWSLPWWYKDYAHKNSQTTQINSDSFGLWSSLRPYQCAKFLKTTDQKYQFCHSHTV